MAASALLLSGCSGSESSTDSSGANGSGSTAGACGKAQLTFTDTFRKQEFVVTDATGMRQPDGYAYALAIGDAPVTFGAHDSDIKAPDGTTYVRLGVGVPYRVGTTVDRRPLEAGQVVPVQGEYGVPGFAVSVFKVGDGGRLTSVGNRDDAAGTVTVTSVGERFCAEVNYSDRYKTVVGTVTADITDTRLR